MANLERFERDAPATLRARVPGLSELINDLRGRLATLVIRTNAPSARLIVRQRDEGMMSLEKRLATRAGTASVELDAEGYETFRREVNLSAGSTVVVDAQLVMKKRDALVVVSARPPAQIFFDGKPLGQTPLEVRPVAGFHELIARAEGYREQRLPMTLGLDDRREIDLTMQKTRGISSKWWFWTGLGVVVLGGIATAIVLTTEGPPSQGTFNPGAVAAP